MIKAPEDANIQLDSEYFSEEFMEALAAEASRLVMDHLKEIDPSINEHGIVVWPVEPVGGIQDWYYQIDWDLLKDEAYIFCSNFSPSDGSEYEAEYIDRIKRARDGFAELVAILDAEISSGKPSAAVLGKM